MKYGFIKACAASPTVKIADCKGNAEKMTQMAEQAADRGAVLILFPELSVTGYTCGDLFLQKKLIDGAEAAVSQIASALACREIIAVVGVPVAYKGSLYNCAAVIYKGSLLGIVPKSYIPNYTEFYEGRHFAVGADIKNTVLPCYAGFEGVAFGVDLVFCCNQLKELRIGVEICEDLWVAQSPSASLAQDGGATVILNPSASDDLTGKAQYRENLVGIQSGKLCCAYVFADSGFGESSTDLVFSGHSMICENATLLASAKRFKRDEAVYADIDLQRLASERRRINTFTAAQCKGFREICFDITVRETPLEREFPCTPFVPRAKTDLDTRCEEILTMQASGLAVRLNNTGINSVVIGLSGGLDSTLALIVCAKAFDMLGLDRKNIHAVTMPCFGTTKRTKSNAERLATALKADFREIDISRSVRSHFDDIGHSEEQHDITYENCQARERTQVLMDLSNKLGGIVVGTGDLSELALGWATYNGDHMSMYSVNCSVPKTLVKYLVKYEAMKNDGALRETLLDIIDTPVSPELLPPDENGNILQITEDSVGPYVLHDFFLYYFVRFGYTPKKLLYLASRSFKDDYDSETVKKWLKVFVKRFFSQQFKRSCLPDGPKVGSVTLSPRGDWRMPSDACAALWLEELDKA